MNRFLIILVIAALLCGCHNTGESPVTAEPTPQIEEIIPESLPHEDEPLNVKTESEPTDIVTTSPPEIPEEITFDNDTLPEGFVYIKAENPNIIIDLRYAGTNNFTGSAVDGYLSEQAAILARNAANALSNVQNYLEQEGLGLLIYDAYRPVKAVEFFMEWAKNDDISTKEDYYPNLKKSSLFSGYIAKKSGHSRGSTVDLTLVDLSTGEALDMGGRFDFFDKISWHSTNLITNEQAQNRKTLKSAMEKFGFYAYSKEWWHYTYSNETFPNDYFNFDVE